MGKGQRIRDSRVNPEFARLIFKSEEEQEMACSKAVNQVLEAHDCIMKPFIGLGIEGVVAANVMFMARSRVRKPNLS